MACDARAPGSVRTPRERTFQSGGGEETASVGAAGGSAGDCFGLINAQTRDGGYA